MLCSHIKRHQQQNTRSKREREKTKLVHLVSNLSRRKLVLAKRLLTYDYFREEKKKTHTNSLHIFTLFFSFGLAFHIISFARVLFSSLFRVLVRVVSILSAKNKKKDEKRGKERENKCITKNPFESFRFVRCVFVR